jgi:hypothetical protein
MNTANEPRERIYNTMRKLRYTILLVILLVSCHDDEPQPSKQLFPTKVLHDGIMQLGLVFDTQGKLIRLDHYNTGAFAGYSIFEYDEHGVTETRRYGTYTKSMTSRSVFTLDDFGRISFFNIHSNYSSVNTVVSFDYDPSGRLIKRQVRDIGEPVAFMVVYTYGDGELYQSSDKIYHPNQDNEYHLQTEYTVGDTPVYEHWRELIMLLHSAGVAEEVMDMFYVGSRATFFGTDGEIAFDTEMSASDQTFNDQGYLTRQVLTYNDLIDNETSSVELVYEYTE